MRRGSAYLFVMIIMFSIFIAVTLSISTTQQTAQNSFIYAENANQYDLLSDCIERFSAELNDIVHANQSDIQNAVLDRLKTYIVNNPESYLFYEPGKENIYDGNFYLKQSDLVRNNQRLMSGNKNRLFTDLYSEEITQILFPIMQNKQTWIYKIDVQEKDTPIQYQVSISPTLQNGICSFAATIENLTTGIYDSISGKIALETDPHLEIFYENYRFKDGVHNSSPLPINESVSIQDHHWSKEKPVAYFSQGQMIDISAFYDGSDPIPTILIAEGENQIFCSDPHKNTFITLLYTKDSISLAEDVILQYKSNILDIPIHDKAFRRKLYDYFGLTDFQSGDIFKVLSPDVAFSLNITALPRYQIIELR